MAKPPVGRILERKSGRKLKPVTVYFDVKQYERLREHAQREGRVMSTLIANLVTAYLDEHDR